MIIEMSKIKFKELSEHVKLLNETGLLEKQVPLVGKTKEDIVKLFVAAVQSVPDDDDGNWTGPVKVADYYSKIVVPKASPTAEEAEEEAEPESEEEPEETEAKPKKEKKEKPVKKEKKEKEEKIPDGYRFGWKPGSKCDKIHQLVITAGEEGITKEEVVKLALKFDSKESFTKNILSGATRMGWITKSDAGKYYPVVRK